MPWLAGPTPWQLDRQMMQLVLRLSSSESARGAAAAWLAAFAAARAAGVPEVGAHARACAAMGAQSGAPGEASFMLAVQCGIDARPPPLLVR